MRKSIRKMRHAIKMISKDQKISLGNTWEIGNHIEIYLFSIWFGTSSQNISMKYFCKNLALIFVKWERTGVTYQRSMGNKSCSTQLWNYPSHPIKYWDPGFRRVCQSQKNIHIGYVCICCAKSALKWETMHTNRTGSHSKINFLCSVWFFLCRRTTVCLLLLETLC